MTLARTVFFGTPSFAVPIFEALREVSNVVAVVCQPDGKPVGRGLSVQAPPVKVAAMAAGIPVVQPTKLRNGEFAAWLREQSADVAVVAAYGRILPDDVLAAPRLGCVNAHASLLPRYRGAAPIQWAIVRGETQSGVCLMQMNTGLDTGDVLSVHSTQIGAEETAGELMTRLSLLAADALRADWSAFLAGNLKRMPQDHSLATLAPLLKEDGLIDWRKTNRGNPRSRSRCFAMARRRHRPSRKTAQGSQGISRRDCCIACPRRGVFRGSVAGTRRHRRRGHRAYRRTTRGKANPAGHGSSK